MSHPVRSSFKGRGAYLFEDGVEDVEGVTEVDTVWTGQLFVVVVFPLLENVELNRQVGVVHLLLPTNTRDVIT